MQSNFLWTFFLFGQSQNEIQDRNYGFSILTIDGLTWIMKINLNPIRLQNDIRGTRHDDQSCYAWWCYCCTLNQIHRQIGLDLKRRREEAKASFQICCQILNDRKAILSVICKVIFRTLEKICRK